MPVETRKDSATALGPMPDVQDPLVPHHGWCPDNPEGWVRRSRQLAGEAQGANPAIVFLGDSITQGWADEGRCEWDRRFVPRNAVNLGIGGDRTQQILWRLADGALDRLNPALVVLLIGVNNLWRDVHEFGPERVADGVAAVVDAIRTKCPRARVLALGILPTQADPAHPLRAVVREVNARSAAALSADETVCFADIGRLFVEDDGRISPEIMHDACHLTPRGYRRFAEALEPLIQEMLSR